MIRFKRVIQAGLLVGCILLLVCSCLGTDESPATDTAQRLQEAQRSSQASAGANGKSAKSNTADVPEDTAADKGVAPDTAAQEEKEDNVQPAAPVTTDGALPDGWPNELPPYPGSLIIVGQRHSENGGVVLSVTLSTADTGQQVLAFYENKATEAGYTKQSSASSGGGGGIAFVKRDQMFAVTFTGKEGQATEVTLQLKPYSGEIPEQASESYYGQEIPLGFPQKMLPLYPGGKVVSVSITDSKSYMLVQTTNDDSDKAVAFFRKYYAGLGWEEHNLAQMPSGVMLSFDNKEGVVTLRTNSDDQGVLAITSTFIPNQ